MIEKPPETPKPKMKLPEMPKMKLPEMPKIKIPKNINLKLPPDLNAQVVLDYIIKTGKDFKDHFSSSQPDRRMKFPYTLSAKVAQFPYKYYFKNNWIFQSLPFGFVAGLPLFWYINKLSNSKSNKATWKAIRQHEKEEARHRFDYKNNSF